MCVFKKKTRQQDKMADNYLEIIQSKEQQYERRKRFLTFAESEEKKKDSVQLSQQYIKRLQDFFNLEQEVWNVPGEKLKRSCDIHMQLHENVCLIFQNGVNCRCFRTSRQCQQHPRLVANNVVNKKTNFYSILICLQYITCQRTKYYIMKNSIQCIGNFYTEQNLF